jgi:hypothetical protein
MIDYALSKFNLKIQPMLDKSERVESNLEVFFSTCEKTF